MSHHIAGNAKLEQFLQTKYAKILSSLVLGEDRLKKSGSIFDVKPWRELIDPILKRIAIHCTESLAYSADHESLLTQDPLNSQFLMRIFDQNELVKHIQVSLNILIIALAQSFQQHNRYLFTSMQIVRT